MRTTSSSQSSSPGVAAAARLCTTIRVALWRSLLLKVQLLFQTVFAQTKAQTLLGKEVYNKLFPKTASLPAPTTTAVHYRFIRGEVVGKALEKGEGKVDSMRAHVDPALCQHPENAMKPRANGPKMWWTCTKCLSRWERLTIQQVEGLNQDPGDQSIVTFGKHMGSTYLQVLEDQNYVQWIQHTVQHGDPSPEQQKLAGYNQTKALEETYEMDGYQYMDQDGEL